MTSSRAIAGATGGLAAISLAATMAACSAFPSPALILYEGQDGSLLAAKGGRLEIRETCLVIAGEAGEAWNVAWPVPITHWDAISQKLTVGDAVAAIGATVRLAGGVVDELDLTNPTWIETPAACFKKPLWRAGFMEVVGD